MNKDFDSDRYYDLQTLAEYSSISVRSLRDYLSDPVNPLPSFCVKRKLLVRRSEFDRWIEGHRTVRTRVDDLVNEVLRDFNV